MEFGIGKYAMLLMKNGQRHLMDGMELTILEKIRTPGEKETYKYLEILEADIIKQEVMKEKIKKEYFRRTRKPLETKLYSRNLIKGIITSTVHLVRYSGPFLNWTREELKQKDQSTRKLMTMHKALYPKDDVDRIYVSRKEADRGLTSTEDSIDASIRHEDQIRKRVGRLNTATRNNTDNMRTNRTTINRKQKWEENQLCGPIKRLINDISHKKTWMWLRKGNLKRETKFFPIAAQNNARPVGWGCRIRRVHLCREVRPHPPMRPPVGRGWRPVRC